MAWQCPVCEEWCTGKRVSPTVRVAMAELREARAAFDGEMADVGKVHTFYHHGFSCEHTGRLGMASRALLAALEGEG